MTRPSHPLLPTLPDALRSAGQGAPWRGAARSLQARVAQRMALVWLLLALVVVPTLGRLHQVAHGGALDRVHAGQQALGLPSPSLPASTEAVGEASPLFLAHHAPVDCLLLDQLALGDALHSTPLVLPEAVPPQAAPTPLAGRRGASHVALFQARGPPAA